MTAAFTQHVCLRPAGLSGEELRVAELGHKVGALSWMGMAWFVVESYILRGATFGEGFERE